MDMTHDIAGLIHAAERDSIAAQLELASCYYTGDGRFIEKSPEKSFYWFNRAATLGAAEAQVLVGGFYEMGQLFDPNPEQALFWYRQAAAQQYPAGMYAIGLCYLNGFGVEQNAGEAISYFTLAARGGDANAQYHLASCYDKGIGITHNKSLALHWYKLSAHQGDVSSMYALGYYYYHLGSPEAYKKALQWLRRAAKRGNGEARALLKKIKEENDCA